MDSISASKSTGGRSYEERCPSTPELQAYSSGRLSWHQSECINAHLLKCRRCDSTLDAIDVDSDTITYALDSLPLGPDDDAELSAAQQALLSDPENLSDSLFPESLSRTIAYSGPDARAPIPQHLGDYELLHRIGRGASGMVYRARHTRLDRIVAIKVLAPARGGSQTLIERFRREMQAVGRLDHPNIVKATDAGDAEGFHYLVMEYFDSVDLSTLLQTMGPLRVADACELIRQAAFGLDCAYEHGMVHRDVKLSNLLFGPGGQVKVLDLGLVAFRNESACEASIAENDGDRPLGTSDYMAPEQWTDFADVDIRADIYGLGCTIFKLLTGKGPFSDRGKGHRSKMAAHLHDPVPSIREFRKDVPSRLDTIVRRMLAKRREERFDRPFDVAHALAPFCRQADLPSLAKTAGITVGIGLPYNARTSRQFSRRQFAVYAAAGLVVASAGIHWSLRSGIERHAPPRWRRLYPRAPAILYPPAADANHHYTFDEASGKISLSAVNPTLVHLGKPTQGRFVLRGAIREPELGGSAGYFFNHETEAKHENSGQTCQAILLESYDDDGQEAIAYHLRWQQLRVEYTDGSQQVRIEPWAAITLPPTLLREFNLLQVALGKSSFPDIVFNGAVLPESQWTLSRESWQMRRVDSMSRRQLENLHLGRLGIVAVSTAAEFHEIELLYG